MRVVFLGTPQAAVPTLEALIRSDHEVPLVVTRPDRAVGRSRRPIPPPVKRAATEAGLPVLQPTKVRAPEFRETLASQAPDALMVVAYGRILPRSVLEVPRLGPINVHFSLLPRYRGAAPVQWALARGESRTGVTTMLMSEGLDEGDVLLEREVAIEPGEHAPALESRLAVLGAELALETLTGLAAGRIEPRPQDPERATYAP
ncbi:MAG: methionyl-tRNA formyltransferase, partial [Actinobacteria bacterium]|nr:methionyl-tRNA formyltransferase [Actinomycetota bacterium]